MRNSQNAKFASSCDELSMCDAFGAMRGRKSGESIAAISELIDSQTSFTHQIDIQVEFIVAVTRIRIRITALKLGYVFKNPCA